MRITNFHLTGTPGLSAPNHSSVYAGPENKNRMANRSFISAGSTDFSEYLNLSGSITDICSGSSTGEIIDALLLLGPIIAGKAAEHRDADDLQRMRRTIRKMENTQNVDSFVRLSHEFQSQLAASAKNAVILLMMHELWIKLIDVTPDMKTSIAMFKDTLIREQKSIYEYIRRQNNKRAGEMMKAHLLSIISPEQQVSIRSKPFASAEKRDF